MSQKKNDPNSRPPTMHDVAKLAGVSQPTVSRVLNRTPTPIPVSEDTQRKVFAAVKELGYRPNMTARSLRTQRTQMISLMIADISNSFYHPIARTVQDVLPARMIMMCLSPTATIYTKTRSISAKPSCVGR
jgi:DNA-binding LacI/PurR family transcriptional regulator